MLGPSTWERIGPAARAGVAAQAGRARLEVPVFAAFDPTKEELAGLRGLPLLTTIGALSGPDRWSAAEVLRAQAGADVVVLPGCGNAAQVDAPVALADAVRGWQPATTRCGG
mgnify:FL=1